jgi:glycosyltransferase involved in cell wall biosynthesis
VHAEREARALAQRGHQVTVLTSRYDDRLPDYEVRDGVKVIRLKVRLHVSKGVIMPSMPYWAWKLIRQVDVVHLHAPQFDAAYMALFTRLVGKQAVLTYHCDLLLPKGMIHLLANQVSNITNHIAALASVAIVHNTRDYAEHSPFLRRYLSKVHPILPPVVVANASEAEVEAFRQKVGIRPGERVIGMNARLATEKGAETLVEAMPAVLAKHPTARVLYAGQYQNVFGEQQYARRLAPLIERLGEHWKFLGIPPDAEQSAFFKACEVTVLPSLNSTESYGLVQVESMACGTPVVASDRPGMRVPVQMTGMGKLFPQEDPAALAGALIDVLDHPQKYLKSPDGLVSLSSPENVAAEYEAVFLKAMKAKGNQAIR